MTYSMSLSLRHLLFPSGCSRASFNLLTRVWHFYQSQNLFREHFTCFQQFSHNFCLMSESKIKGVSAGLEDETASRWTVGCIQMDRTIEQSKGKSTHIKGVGLRTFENTHWRANAIHIKWGCSHVPPFEPPLGSALGGGSADIYTAGQKLTPPHTATCLQHVVEFRLLTSVLILFYLCDKYEFTHVSLSSHYIRTSGYSRPHSGSGMRQLFYIYIFINVCHPTWIRDIKDTPR